jgi:hypothetical protein
MYFIPTPRERVPDLNVTLFLAVSFGAILSACPRGSLRWPTGSDRPTQKGRPTSDHSEAPTNPGADLLRSLEETSDSIQTQMDCVRDHPHPSETGGKTTAQRVSKFLAREADISILVSSFRSDTKIGVTYRPVWLRQGRSRIWILRRSWSSDTCRQKSTNRPPLDD